MIYSPHERRVIIKRSKAVQPGEEFGRPSPNTFVGNYGWPEMTRSSTTHHLPPQRWLRRKIYPSRNNSKSLRHERNYSSPRRKEMDWNLHLPRQNSNHCSPFKNSKLAFVRQRCSFQDWWRQQGLASIFFAEPLKETHGIHEKVE
jgi:hypothetical protein